MRITTALFTVLLLTATGCSGDAKSLGDLDLCGLVDPGDLPGELSPGFPRPGAEDEDQACRWETTADTELRMDVITYGQASALGEHWGAQPRSIGGRDVYIDARGFTEPGGPVVECSTATQHDKDTLRMTLAVDEPRGDLCAELTTIATLVIDRLP